MGNGEDRLQDHLCHSEFALFLVEDAFCRAGEAGEFQGGILGYGQKGGHETAVDSCGEKVFGRPDAGHAFREFRRGGHLDFLVQYRRRDFSLAVGAPA